METIRLRPHHALCTAFYTGRGYSAAFNENMDRILSLCRAGAVVHLTHGPDDICAACPNMREGLCTSQEKVCRYDAAVQQLCGWRTGEEMPWKAFCTRTEEAILSPGLRETVCGDCEWNDLCRSISAQK